MKEKTEMINAKKENLVYIVLIFVAALCGFIWAFTNAGIDVTYQISMSYRFLKGDIPFLEMWEPHQTSIFINVPLIWIFEKVTGSTDGIVLYLQVAGIAIRAIISFYLYKTLEHKISKPLNFGIAIVFFMITPKDYAIPEFGNMQLWFSTLLFCYLYRYVSSGKTRYIFCAAVSTCLLALSYPSCVLAYIPVVILIGLYGSKQKWQAVIVYTLVCIFIGITFITAVVSRMGIEKFFECVEGMISIEPSHTVNPLIKYTSYIKDLGVILLCMLTVFAVGFVIERMIVCLIAKEKIRKSRVNRPILVVVVLGVYDLLFFLNILSATNRCAYGIIFVNAIILGFAFAKEMPIREKQIYVTGTSISLTCLLATLLLTDLPFIVSTPYTVLAVGMALIPIYNFIKKNNEKSINSVLVTFSSIFIVLLAFRASYIRTPIVGRGQIFVTSLNELSLVRKGPAKGMITDQNSSVRERDGYEDFLNHVEPEDKILVVNGLVNSLTYMYTDAEIAAPSVMSETHFSKNMLKYYEINPEKYPTVLAVASYGGELDYEVRANQWIYEWIMNEFGATRTEQGTYWTFFYR